MSGSVPVNHCVYNTGHSNEEFLERLPSMPISHHPLNPTIFESSIFPDFTFRNSGMPSETSFTPDDLLDTSLSKRQKLTENHLPDSTYLRNDQPVFERGSTLGLPPNALNAGLPTLRSLLEANASEGNEFCAQNSYDSHTCVSAQTFTPESEDGNSMLLRRLSGASQSLGGDSSHQVFYPSRDDEGLALLSSVSNAPFAPANLSVLTARDQSPSRESSSSTDFHLSEQEGEGRMSPERDCFLSFNNDDTQTSMINHYGSLCLSEPPGITAESSLKLPESADFVNNSQSYSMIPTVPNDFTCGPTIHGTSSTTGPSADHETPHVSYSDSISSVPPLSAFASSEPLPQSNELSTPEYNHLDRRCTTEALHSTVLAMNEQQQQQQNNVDSNVTSDTNIPSSMLVMENHATASEDWTSSLNSSTNVLPESPHSTYTQTAFAPASSHTSAYISEEENQRSFSPHPKPSSQEPHQVPEKKTLLTVTSKPHSGHLVVTRKVRAPLVYKHSTCVLRTESSLRDTLTAPGLTALPGMSRKVGGLLCSRDRSTDVASRANWNATNSLQYARFVSQASGRGTGLPVRPLCQFTQGRKRMSRFTAPAPQLPAVINTTYSRKKCTSQGDDIRGGYGSLPISLASFPSAPSPHNFFPDYSVRSQARVVILRQPEAQHRARYQTEGSRGAVKDVSGHGFPTVQLLGWNGRASLQVFVGTEYGRTRPHPFYQAYLVVGKSTKYCVQTIRDGVNVIEMSFSNTNNWTLSVECVGILKLRKTDVEQRSQVASTNGNNMNASSTTNDCLRNGASDELVSKTRAAEVPRTKINAKPIGGGGRKPGKARLVFRVLLFHENTGSIEAIQVASDPILCTQLIGDPELCRLSLSESGPDGGGDLFILGKNLGKECHVIFRQLASKSPLNVKLEDNHGDPHPLDAASSETLVSWQKEAALEVEFSQQTHLVCRVPAYDGPSAPLVHPLRVQVIIRLGQRWSNPFPFTYLPDAASFHAGTPTYKLTHTSKLATAVGDAHVDYSHPSVSYLPDSSSCLNARSSAPELFQLASSSIPANDNPLPDISSSTESISRHPMDSDSSFFLPPDHVNTHSSVLPSNTLLPVLNTIPVPESSQLQVDPQTASTNPDLLTQGDLSTPSLSCFIETPQHMPVTWTTEHHPPHHLPPPSNMN
ncbi:nuclear factor of activated T-cells cytoplasmic calcineurin-dependent [Clonorchis sinensis]|uniref:Nuclear factor of activated T-cells cytoplasmic calcineurin-dependent n=1 Tax=Clonorchis sinensis TaxID=79923 RepID=G7YDS4_CLOSI|nr:nuclear factor of activated T-cells cytoplasmic calcineurin-dependent [Clonorchis sinensis]